MIVGTSILGSDGARTGGLSGGAHIVIALRILLLEGHLGMKEEGVSSESSHSRSESSGGEADGPPPAQQSYLADQEDEAAAGSGGEGSGSEGSTISCSSQKVDKMSFGEF